MPIDSLGRNNKGWTAEQRASGKAVLMAQHAKRVAAREGVTCACGRPVFNWVRVMCSPCYYRWYRAQY